MGGKPSNDFTGIGFTVHICSQPGDYTDLF